MKIPLGGALAGMSIALCVMATSGAKPRNTGVWPAATKKAKEKGKLATATMAIGKAEAKAAKERVESKAKANAAKKEKAEAMKLQWARGQEAKKWAHFLNGHKKELSTTTLARMLSSSDTSMDDNSSCVLSSSDTPMDDKFVFHVLVCVVPLVCGTWMFSNPAVGRLAHCPREIAQP